MAAGFTTGSLWLMPCCSTKGAGLKSNFLTQSSAHCHESVAADFQYPRNLIVSFLTTLAGRRHFLLGKTKSLAKFKIPFLAQPLLDFCPAGASYERGDSIESRKLSYAVEERGLSRNFPAVTPQIKLPSERKGRFL